MTLLIDNMRTEHDRKVSFLKFIEEREKIRKLKEAGKPRPWTDDPILHLFSFCNVRRADDRVTKYIGEWASGWSSTEKWFAYCIARWINEPATLEKLPRKWNPREYKNVLRNMDQKGIKIFRAAYIITGVVAGPGMKKYAAVVDKVLSPLWDDPPGHLPDTFEECWKLLRLYPGQGTFMAGQIAFDWHTFHVRRFKDAKTWAPLGPGSIKGLNIVFRGDAEAKKMSQEQGVLWLRELADLVDDKLPHIGRRIDLMDIQNCCCEFNKYVRGYSKTQYEPYQESFL